MSSKRGAQRAGGSPGNAWSMTYRLRFTRAVNKQVSKLDRPVATRVKRYLENLDLTNPRTSGKPLAGDDKFWRYRVGDYRILASISDE